MSQFKDDIELVKFDMPPPKKIPRKKRRTNQISTPPPQSPISSVGRTSDVIEMFSIKPKPSPPSAAKRSSTLRKLRQNTTSSKELLMDEISVCDSQDSSDISDDVFLAKRRNTHSSIDSSRSRSDTKSYREKINDRFKSIKGMAGKSTKKANRFKDITETILLEKIRRESDAIDEELENVRSKFDTIIRKHNIVDFFLLESSQNDEESEEHRTEIRDGDVTESREALTSEELTIFHLPETLNFSLKISEQDLLFKPKSNIVDINDKIEDEPRRLEEEGFYVPGKLKIPQAHINLLEHRLSQDSKKWFNCEGNLDIIENPISNISIRPQFKPIKDSAVFIPAAIIGEECEEIVVVQDDILKLEIFNLKFNHHPLFSLEHVYAEKLRTLYQEHQRNVAKNTVGGLKQRLKAMILVKSKLETPDKIEKYAKDIAKLKSDLLEELANERTRIKKMFATWKRIKNIRETKKYSNTSIKLAIGKMKVDNESEIEDQKSFFEILKLTEEEESDDYLKRLKNNLKPTGEPKLTFVLTEDNEITLNDLNNQQEITRRQVVSATKLSLRILCNKVEVCKTKFVNLSQDFECRLAETIYLQPTNIPKFLTIQIIEQPKALMKRTIGEISIKIPSQNSKKSENKQVFEKLEIVHYKHEGVGSGSKLKDIDSNLDPLLDDDSDIKTSGFVTYSLKWDNQKAKGQENPIEYNRIIDEIVGKSGEIDLDKLSEWLDQDQLDPQDPKNSIFYEYYCTDDGFSALPTRNSKHFRLSPHLNGFQFCKQKVIDDNLRLTVLQLRDRNEPEFDSMVIPNRIREIPAGILDDYHRRIDGEKQDDDGEDQDEIETRRSKGRKKLKQIYVKVFQKCKNSQNHLTFEDVVDEKFLMHFEKIVKNLVASATNWFKWSPVKQPIFKFKREPKIEAKNTWERHAKVSTKILVKVIAAFNVPKRTENRDEVKPFVGIDFGNVITRTSTGSGANPTWNEELVLPLDPINVDHLNPNALNDNLIVDLFDEGDTELPKYGGVKSRTWLGCVEIPLSAICSNGLQGMFKVRTPQLILGYESELDRHTKSPKTTAAPSNPQSFLNLNVSLESNIPKMNPCLEELRSSEVPYLRDHIFKWNQSYNYNYPSRKFSAFAIDSNASTTCIIRYIKAVEPPQINAEGFDVTPEQCAKFVSLIPFVDSNKFYQNIWLSVNEFLQFMVGSIIDHAVALTCYFLALKLDAWLLLGFGVPSGSTAYVLVREYDNNDMATHYIFDVVLGEKFYLNDVFCPLHRVFCILNDTNVWANIQRGDNLNLLRFDLNRRSDWMPLFQNDLSPPTNSVHGRLLYSPLFEGIDELELVLERKIRKKVAKLRQLDRTIWNHKVSSIFKSALSSFENYSMFGKNHMDALLKLRSSVKFSWVRGLIVNLPFTSVSRVVKQIKSYGIHLQEASIVEFASAVYLRSYPNQTITVWIFLACFSNPEV